MGIEWGFNGNIVVYIYNIIYIYIIPMMSEKTREYFKGEHAVLNYQFFGYIYIMFRQIQV